MGTPNERCATGNAVKTTCPYCGVGCGIEVSRDGQGGVTVKGDDVHPANYGRLCSKGSALGETLGLEGRLLYPEIHGVRTDWDTALKAVADGFKEIIEQHGPDAVAFYVSGQLLTEDYYAANKLMKGFIGSGNIDTNSRLCMSSAVAAYKRAFGADTVPCDYTDLEQADLVVMVGSNLAWCHPVLYQRIVKARQERGLKIVVIDPRRTPTCDLAELHLPVKAGTDTVLFNGLLSYLDTNGGMDEAFVSQHTEGLDSALQAARDEAGDLASVANVCDVDAGDLETFYSLFLKTQNVVTVYSMGVNQSSRGTDKANSIINCHLFTGRIGRPGTGPFSITGQPNAMGGREVGGLANMLAAHMHFENPDDVDRVSRFWRTGTLAKRQGLKAVELFQAIGRGDVKAVWIMATNPAVSLPDADRVRAALKACELVVVSDCIANTDTTACADILLPAAAWGEKDGTVTNSERRISRQRAFRPLPADARPDWWIITQVAHRMGFAEQFDYRNAADIFREHAALSAFENDGRRDFDIGGLAALSDDAYDALSPVQWPVKAATKAKDVSPRFFSEGRFYTASGKANFVPIAFHPPVNAPDNHYPLILNSGRIRDQWHTMTRTGLAPRLNAHLPEPFLQIHPDDAEMRNIEAGGLAKIESRWGAMLARVAITGDVRRGTVFAPIHWNEQFASLSRVDAVINPEVDAVSGEPEFKHTPVDVHAYLPKWHGFALSRQPLASVGQGVEYCVRVRGQSFWRYELAGETLPDDLPGWARMLFGVKTHHPDYLEYRDDKHHRYRGVLLDNHRLQACLFIGDSHRLPERAWLAGLFAKTDIDLATRLSLLAGRPGDPNLDTGRTVCSCFGVGLNTIRRAVKTKGLATAEAVGCHLKAGTNCGSCIPELKAIIAECQADTEAA